MKRKKLKPERPDIIEIILAEHVSLKKFITVMKDPDKTLNERFEAFVEFAPLLLAHAKPEEKALYMYMRTVDDLRQASFEGEVEHGLADQMVEEVKRTTDAGQLGARIKVLAELVEHHIKEEENVILPSVKKEVSREELMQLAEIFLDAQEEVIAGGEDDAPHESELRENERQKSQPYSTH